jgi:hypothetical protein
MEPGRAAEAYNGGGGLAEQRSQIPITFMRIKEKSDLDPHQK